MRFSAATRSATTDVGAGALLFLRFMPKPENEESGFYVTPLATVASGDEPLQSPQWTTLAVEAEVPEAADSVVIGLVMAGNGIAWFGDLAFAAA